MLASSVLGIGSRPCEHDDLVPQAAEIDTELDQHLGRETIRFTQKTKEEMLRTDVQVAKVLRFMH